MLLLLGLPTLLAFCIINAVFSNSTRSDGLARKDNVIPRALTESLTSAKTNRRWPCRTVAICRTRRTCTFCRRRKRCTVSTTALSFADPPRFGRSPARRARSCGSALPGCRWTISIWRRERATGVGRAARRASDSCWPCWRATDQWSGIVGGIYCRLLLLVSNRYLRTVVCFPSWYPK